MDCHEASEFYFLFADDEMTEEVLVAFRAHVGCCPECQRRVGYVRKLLAVLRDGCRRQSAPPRLRVQILTMLSQRQGGG